MKAQIISVKTNTNNIQEAIQIVWEYIFNDFHEDPDRFILENGRKFVWRPTIAHYFADHGRISETDFCLYCEIPETNIHFSNN